MHDHTSSKLANHQIRHQATHKVGCRPGDCIWSLQSSSGVCTGMKELTYSLYHPRGEQVIQIINDTDVNDKVFHLFLWMVITIMLFREICERNNVSVVSTNIFRLCLSCEMNCVCLLNKRALFLHPHGIIYIMLCACALQKNHIYKLCNKSEICIEFPIWRSVSKLRGHHCLHARFLHGQPALKF